MKKPIMMSLLAVLIAFTQAAEAQTTKKVRRQSTVQQQTTKKVSLPTKQTNSETITLRSVSASNAFDSTGASNRLSISDPVLKTLRLQASGSTPLISSSGIVGMPKRAYGFSNGKILLRPTTAPSSGTMYGSGAVGTGTTLMGPGTGENALGVNGKSPYAGPYFWGSKLPGGSLPVTDSTKR